MESRIISDFLNVAVKSKQRVDVFLRSGVCLKGVIADFDLEAISIQGEGGRKTVVPREWVASLSDGVDSRGL
jgi:sRNA-binding regulator protein Hfq